MGDFSEVEVEVSEEDSAAVFQAGEAQQEAGKDIRMICPKCKVAKLVKRKAKGKAFSVEYCRKKAALSG